MYILYIKNNQSNDLYFKDQHTIQRQIDKFFDGVSVPLKQ